MVQSSSGLPDVTVLAAFIAGTTASLGLCAVIRLPIVVAYVAGVAGSKRQGVFLSGLFALGLVVGTGSLGLIAGASGEGPRSLLSWNRYLFWCLGVGLFVTGVFLSRLINPHLLPVRWQKAAGRLAWAGLPGAFLLGCAFGLLQTPACPHCGAAVQTFVEIVCSSSLCYGLLLFTFFATGQGITMLAVGALTSLVMPDLLRWLRTRMCSIEPRIQLLAGNVLMILGIHFIIVG